MAARRRGRIVLQFFRGRASATRREDADLVAAHTTRKDTDAVVVDPTFLTPLSVPTRRARAHVRSSRIWNRPRNSGWSSISFRAYLDRYELLSLKWSSPTSLNARCQRRTSYR